MAILSSSHQEDTLRTANSSSERDQIARMITVAHNIGGEGDPIDSYTFDLQDWDDIGDVLDLYRHVTQLLQATRAVKGAVGERLAQLLGEGGAACYGSNIVRYKLGSTETLIDPRSYAEYVTNRIGSGDVHLSQVFNVNSAKVSWMTKAERDTFYIRTDDAEPKLTDIPIAKSPKFLSDMEDGDIRIKEDTT